jgi:hypothetical protein
MFDEIKDFSRHKVGKADPICFAWTTLPCVFAKFFCALFAAKELKSTWRMVFPIYSMFPSVLEFVYLFTSTAKRETRVLEFWRLRIFVFSALGSSIACFVVGYLWKRTLANALGALLGASALEFCVSSYWAFRFWKTSSLRDYAPVCNGDGRRDLDESYTDVDGPLAQVYSRLLADLHQVSEPGAVPEVFSETELRFEFHNVSWISVPSYTCSTNNRCD